MNCVAVLAVWRERVSATWAKKQGKIAISGTISGRYKLKKREFRGVFAECDVFRTANFPALNRGPSQSSRVFAEGKQGSCCRRMLKPSPLERYLTALAGFLAGFGYDLHVTVKGGQEFHQPFDRVFAEVPFEET